MIKTIAILFTCLYTVSSYALDSGTLSATLCYQITGAEPEQEKVIRLFDALEAQLKSENADQDIVNRVEQCYAGYVAGENVDEKIRECWIDLTSFESRSVYAAYNEIKRNPLVSSKHYRTIKPWLLPDDHPMKNNLDAIFRASRAIRDKEAFEAAGFITFAVQPRSYIRVARHPELPGYVVKVYLDTLLKVKRNTPGWKWFARRCEGAKKIAEILKRKKIQHFKVAKKWIYPLPLNPKPIKNSKHSPKAEILLAEDMDIFSNQESIEAWKTQMTKAHLDELFVIISFAQGSSYRPDNIPFSRDGKFAFVDTEYPDRKPNFNTPKSYFSAEMQDYWQQLINRGGP